MTSVHDVKDLESIVVLLIEEESGASGVTSDTRLEDLGMDSLTFSEVLMSIEKDYGINLDQLQKEFAVDREATVAGLVAAITAEIA